MGNIELTTISSKTIVVNFNNGLINTKRGKGGVIMEQKSMGNDKMLILEDEKNFEKNSQDVEQLMKEFAEELRPIGIACKTWAKSV